MFEVEMKMGEVDHHREELDIQRETRNALAAVFIVLNQLRLRPFLLMPGN